MQQCIREVCIYSLEFVFCGNHCVSSWRLSPYHNPVAQLTKEVNPNSSEQDGFPKHIAYAQAIVFGPTTHRGIGSISLRIEQGIMIVMEIMQTLRTPGYGQDILRIFLKTFQHVSGMSQQLLAYPDH